ncbi:MAG: hypothetical protein ACTJHT_13100 [Sphingobacterium sp.]|uniref:hypothetical protein n=1 Tax=Sphingobacterium sp. JB170 TaxID=1434842 RepID=UPI00097EB362|nr:hypothetical protein [Sphingobacterium sp. JB170]SJN37316.1 hypothetical protein FM107_09290 [Sphingobacterium sp. JB170]
MNLNKSNNAKAIRIHAHSGITLAILMFLMSSCTQVTQSFKDTFTQPAEGGSPGGTAASMQQREKENEQRTNYLRDAGYLRAAKKKLEKLTKFQGKVLNVYSDIHFYDDGRIMLNLQDPSIAENIDTYTFRDGQWQTPEAMRVSGHDSLNDGLIPLDTVDFGTVTMIYDYLRKESQSIEGAADVSHIYLIIRPINIGNQWYASLQGARATYSLRATLSGEILRFERD